MIITFLAPKGGVGSSTIAALTAWETAGEKPVLLIDAAPDRSLDLFTDTAHIVSAPYTGSRQDSAVRPRDRKNLQVMEFPQGPDAPWETLQAELLTLRDTEVIVDAGIVGEAALAKLLSLSDRVVVVLTQDNQVLRAADALLGRIRGLGGDASFVINKLEDRAQTELGTAEDIFDLLEEECLGSLLFRPELRYITNTGALAALPADTTEEIRALCHGLFPGDVLSAPVVAQNGSGGEADPAEIAVSGNEAMEENALGTDGPAEAKPAGVLEGIRSFFRSFRKG